MRATSPNPAKRQGTSYSDRASISRSAQFVRVVTRSAVQLVCLLLLPLAGCVVGASDDLSPLEWAAAGTAEPVTSAPPDETLDPTAEAATGGDDGSGETGGITQTHPLCEREPTYDDFGVRFFALRCGGCHSDSLAAHERSGAPLGIDFDDLADIKTHAHGIYEHALRRYDMPPASLLAGCEYDKLRALLGTLDVDSCLPSCEGKDCGADGCGGVCGVCAQGQRCDFETGSCETKPCVPDCVGAACGPDGCGGSCGACAAGKQCTDDRSCACAPQCEGLSCGEDGCGGICGECSQAQTVCGSEGSCVCIPDCAARICGADGCGGSCGRCPAKKQCNAQGDGCECAPNCSDRECGADGCGGSCGECPGNFKCNDRAGECVSNCDPDCVGRSCGGDGCGGSCGTCSDGESCTSSGACACEPDCLGRACGPDGCGGSCGDCPNTSDCSATGQCTCTPSCVGRECGSDGCGGSCGVCDSHEQCDAGTCVIPCIPQCDALECGADGCGGNCGSCSQGQHCLDGSCAWPQVGFPVVYQLLVAEGCNATRCHGDHKDAAGLDLSSEAIAYQALVGQTSTQCGDRLLVQAYAPDSSYLVNKLTGFDLCGGSKMPKKGPGLDEAKLDTIRAWIATGATRN